VATIPHTAILDCLALVRGREEKEGRLPPRDRLIYLTGALSAWGVHHAELAELTGYSLSSIRAWLYGGRRMTERSWTTLTAVLRESAND
jgi:hypothetical protein